MQFFGFAFTHRICFHPRIPHLRCIVLSKIRQGLTMVKAVKAKIKGEGKSPPLPSPKNTHKQRGSEGMVKG